MATNKFATVLSRNTHKVVVILVYAVLEWVLIMLLLLNSLFSYLITKFAKCFGLKPPCPWCSTVDHILEPGQNRKFYRDILCDTHAAEVSKLGYCSNHRKLAETHIMCENCLASRPDHIDDTIGMTQRVAFLSWISQNRLEFGERILRCSCCKESLSSKVCSPYLLLKHSWGGENYIQKGHLIVEAIEDEKDEDDIEHEAHDDEGVADEHQILSDIESFILREVGEDRSSSLSNLQCDEKEAEKYEKEGYFVIEEQDPSGTEIFGEDNSLEMINLHSEKYIYCETNRLIPVELIDSSTITNLQTINLESDSQTERQLSVSEEKTLLMMDESSEKMIMEELESFDMNTVKFERSSVLNFKKLEEDLDLEPCGQSHSTQTARTLSNNCNNVEVDLKELHDTTSADHQPQSQEKFSSFTCTQEDKSSTSDDDAEIPNVFDEFVARNNLSDQSQAQEPGSSFPCMQEDKASTSDDDAEVPNAFDEFISQNNLSDQPQAEELGSSFQCIQKYQSSTSADDAEIPNAVDEFMVHNNLCLNHNENSNMLEEAILVEKKKEGLFHQLSGTEEDKVLDTSSSLDSLHYLHKKLMLFEKTESAEESLDGSVVSEVEGGDPSLTIERLKATLKAERKALSALYQELEEERSASAIAANQTMAMITRVQEEKAAMQMEALQYQRMMEEQSEYDQEALELLNDLMIKREKEKAELEKELEVSRKKVLDYEAKERIKTMRRMRDGSVRSRDSSSTCSNVRCTEELSIDLNSEARDEDNGFYIHQEEVNNNETTETVSNLEEMALDCVNNISALDESLAEYEEERLSILDQLKALEEKLITLGAGEELLQEVNMIKDSSAYRTKYFDENPEFSSPEDNGISNGFSDDKHSPTSKTMGSLAKRLLPLLDAAENGTEQTIIYEEQVEAESLEMQNSSISNLELDSKKLAIEEEVDHVYERLQALETDRDFLKNCMSSINKGDKGMDLLQEILQHLRDLKTVELRAKTMGDDPLW